MMFLADDFVVYGNAKYQAIRILGPWQESLVTYFTEPANSERAAVTGGHFCGTECRSSPAVEIIRARPCKHLA
jgi:hypothetical protein